MIDVWQLEPWKDAILARWNEINLYSLTRGINRFLGLEMMLCEIDATYTKIDGLSHYSKWCKETITYSNSEVKSQITKGAHRVFEMVLEWSERVNHGVELIADQIKPFDGVSKALKLMRDSADIAIVSSANPGAVRDEWTRFGLINWVDYVMAQDAGTKFDCIAKLLQNGYAKDHVVMIGDALGDRQAAEENGILYFPILAGQENTSWEQWIDEGCFKFYAGTYSGSYQDEQIERFRNNLMLPK